MTVLAALLMVVGTGCHLEKQKSICAHGVWITTILTATFTVLVASNQCDTLRWVVLSCVWALLLFVMIEMLGLLRKIKSKLED